MKRVTKLAAGQLGLTPLRGPELPHSGGSLGLAHIFSTAPDIERL